MCFSSLSRFVDWECVFFFPSLFSFVFGSWSSFLQRLLPVVGLVLPFPSFLKVTSLFFGNPRVAPPPFLRNRLDRLGWFFFDQSGPISILFLCGGSPPSPGRGASRAFSFLPDGSFLLGRRTPFQRPTRRFGFLVDLFPSFDAFLLTTRSGPLIDLRSLLQSMIILFLPSAPSPFLAQISPPPSLRVTAPLEFF